MGSLCSFHLTATRKTKTSQTFSFFLRYRKTRREKANLEVRTENAPGKRSKVKKQPMKKTQQKKENK